MSSEESSKVLVECIAKFLRGAHPTKTAAHVASKIGFSEYRVGKWLELSSAPNGAAMIALTAAYGPEFLAAIMPTSCSWIDESVRAARLARIEAEIAELRTLASELGGAAR